MDINWKDQLKMGDLTIANRVIMATMTRERCDPKLGIPTPLVAQYYAQRAGAGLIMTEGAAWSPRGIGAVGAACLYNQDQMKGWKTVIDRVHSKGTKIFVQLFHSGRGTHPLKINGLEHWAPSPIAIRQNIRDLGTGFTVPKQMTLEDIQTTKKQYEQSVKLAKEAGFDGIQLQGAHGYLVDQFLRTSANKRTDSYGGSVQNRVKYCLQLIDITLKYFAPCRIGIKISPASRLKDMYDQNPLQTFTLLLEELDKRKIGFVEIRESTEAYPFKNLYPLSQRQQIPDVCKALRQSFSGLLIGNDSFTPQTGLIKMREGFCDAISFGRLYISNPDLAERIINNWEVNNKWDPKTFYGTENGAKGLIDYPFYGKL